MLPLMPESARFKRFTAERVAAMPKQAVTAEKEVRPLHDCPKCGRWSDRKGFENPVKTVGQQVRCGICGGFIRRLWQLLEKRIKAA